MLNSRSWESWDYQVEPVVLKPCLPFRSLKHSFHELLSFFPLSSALGSECETGDRPQSLSTRRAQPKGEDDKSIGSDSSLY